MARYSPDTFHTISTTKLTFSQRFKCKIC